MAQSSLPPAEVAESPLTHFDASGAAHMVDVGAKAITTRTATACGRIEMQAQTLAQIRAGTAKKGDVLGVARIAGIQAAKRTADWIPLCHPLMISAVRIELTLDDLTPAVICQCTVTCQGRTGVEMEALTAVAAALLTIYDMCKAMDRGMRIADIALVEKSGGRSGHWQRHDVPAPSAP